MEEVAINTNRNYKNSMFCSLLSDPDNFREACNAITGSNFGPEVKMENITLDDALFMEEINDVAFLIDDRLIVLIEHQSTINYNMPLRALIYAGRLYEKVMETKNIYREKMIPIPRAEFYVLYNGTDDFPEKATMRLSDMFKSSPKNKKSEQTLELVVAIYNINKGYNPELLSKCEALYDYGTFVEQVRKRYAEVRKQGLGRKVAREKAVRDTVAGYKKYGISEKFIKKFASEVENMIFTKWNWDDAKEIWQEEARETGWEKGWWEGWEKGKVEGWKEGRQKGKQEGKVEGWKEGKQEGKIEGWEQGIQEEKRKNAKTMKNKNIDTNTIAEITGLTIDEILTL
jgi:hypothetical protein